MTSAKCLRKDTAKVEGLVADVPQSSHFSQQEDSSVPFWVREWGITNVYERTGKSSRCPSFLAGESVKDGQKHGNIKQHTPTNRPNKKDLGSLLKKWEHADVIPPTPTIWSRAPDPGYGLSWKHGYWQSALPDWTAFGFDSLESQETQQSQCEWVHQTFSESTVV